MLLILNLATLTALRMNYLHKRFFRVTPNSSNSDTASEEDFDSAVKDVTFQPGETGPKFVEIGLVDDGDDEPTEKFTVSLSSNSNAVLGGPSSVNIQDDDGNCVENLSFYKSSS